jgi:hypothetical protein
MKTRSIYPADGDEMPKLSSAKEVVEWATTNLPANSNGM